MTDRLQEVRDRQEEISRWVSLDAASITTRLIRFKATRRHVTRNARRMAKRCAKVSARLKAFAADPANADLLSRPILSGGSDAKAD